MKISHLFALVSGWAVGSVCAQALPLPGQAAPAAKKPAAVAALPQGNGQWQLLGDGATVLSPDGRLQWMRCSMGQDFRDGQCQGQAKGMDQRDASNEIKRMNFSGGFAGQKDWRLPQAHELQSLVFCEKGFRERKQSVSVAGQAPWALPEACAGENFLRPTIDPIVFPNSPEGWVWTDTADAHRVINMWAVNFSSGAPAAVGRHAKHVTVRAVRQVRP